jgi:hypothetical protein
VLEIGQFAALMLAPQHVGGSVDLGISHDERFAGSGLRRNRGGLRPKVDHEPMIHPPRNPALTGAVAFRKVVACP